MSLLFKFAFKIEPSEEKGCKIFGAKGQSVYYEDMKDC